MPLDLMGDERWFYSKGIENQPLFNLWTGDRVRLRGRGNPIAEITEVKMIGRGHDNALYTVKLNNDTVKKVRSWDIDSWAMDIRI